LALSHYNAGDYALALKEFLEAQELTPRKSIQLNIARTHNALGDAESAREAYMTLIRDYADASLSEQVLTAKEREEAEQEITNACRKLFDLAEYQSARSALRAAQGAVTGKSARTIGLLLGRTLETLEDDVAAYHVYEEVLQQDTQSEAKLRLTEKERGEVATGFERVRRRTATVTGRLWPSGTSIRIGESRLVTDNGDVIEPADFMRGIRLKVGKHTLAFSKSGYMTENRVIELTPDDTIRVDVSLSPTPSEPVAPPVAQVPSPSPDTRPGGAAWERQASPYPIAPPYPPPDDHASAPAASRSSTAAETTRPAAPAPEARGDATSVYFYLAGAIWEPLARTRVLAYAGEHPAGMKEGGDSPFRLSFDGVPKGATTGLVIWGSSSSFAIGFNMMLQYRRYNTDFETVGGTRLGGLAFDEFLGCLCLGGGSPRSGIQFFVGPLFGGAVARASLDPNRPRPFAIQKAHHIELGGALELRYVVAGYFYAVVGLQFTHSFSSIAVQDTGGSSTLAFPVSGMQGVWLGLGLQL
jgi:hypothetical protein